MPDPHRYRRGPSCPLFIHFVTPPLLFSQYIPMQTCRLAGNNSGNCVLKKVKRIFQLSSAKKWRFRQQTKRIDTTCGGFYPLGTPVSTLGITRRKSETGDRSENRVRQSGYSTVSFVKCSQFTDTVLLHMRFTLRRRDIPVSRNSFARYYGRHLRALSDDKCYTVGCDDLGAP